MLGWDFFWKSPSGKHTPFPLFLQLAPVGLEGREETATCTQHLHSVMPGSPGTPATELEPGMEHRVEDSDAFRAWQVWSKGLKS